MFLPNWSAKAEYLYYSLSNGYASTTIADTANTWAYGIGASRSFNGNIVRAGVNYHFNWGAPAAVVAKY
jgi:outer membrane immunogenic protein